MIVRNRFIQMFYNVRITQPVVIYPFYYSRKYKPADYKSVTEYLIFLKNQMHYVRARLYRVQIVIPILP